MSPRAERRITAAILALIALLALAGAAAWWQRLALARWWTLRELARLGATPASVEVARFDASRLELRALRAGEEDALAVDAIDADYTLRDLWRGRVGALRMSGIRVKGEIGADGPRFGGLEAMGAGGGDEARAPSGGAGLRLPALPSRQLVIEDASAEIATAQGPLTARLSANAQEQDGVTRVRADLVAEHARALASARLELAGQADAISGGAGIGLRIEPGAALGLPVSSGSLSLAAQIEISGPEILVSLKPGPFAATRSEGADAQRFEGSTPALRLRTRLEPGGALAPVQVESSGGELLAPGFVARGFEIDASYAPPWRIDGKLAVRELADAQKPARAPVFSLESRLAPRDPGLAFDLRAAATRPGVVLRAQGSFDPGAGSGEAKLQLEPLRFAKDGLQPAQLLPLLARRIASATGSLEAAGHAQLSAGATRLTLDLAARDLGFETPLAKVADVNGTLRLEGPTPLSTPPGQLISIGRIAFGLDLTNGLVSGQLRPDGVFAIEKAEWQLLGGRVRTAGDVDPGAAHQALVLEAEDLDLAQLLALIDLEGLSGEGRLDGRLPIDRSAEAILIRGGVIAARPGAHLRYHPAAGVASLKHSTPGMDLLLGAFENLQVEKLEVDLDGDANGPIKLALHVVGVNPDFQGGRPIHYNLSIDSRLADLLRQGAAAYRIPQEIEERLQRFGQRPQ